MPCRSDFGEPSYYDGNYNRDASIRLALDAATRAACDLRTILRRGGTEKDLCEDTRTWIKQHDAWDRRRIKQEEEAGIRERARQAALAKLNLDDRRVLGL